MIRASSPKNPINPAIETELHRLAKAPIIELRKQYREVLRSDLPKSFGPDLLRRSIGHKIQEKALATLSRATQTRLNELIQAVATKPNGQLKIPRHIKPGAELVRTWKGKSYRVTVKPDGFAYGGKTYPGLSEIATHITGTRWNGPRFFGLRSNSESAADGK